MIPTPRLLLLMLAASIPALPGATMDMLAADIDSYRFAGIQQAPECVSNPSKTYGAAKPMDELAFEMPFGPDAPVEMATVWGDRSKGPHGTVGVFGAGFDSGPHTHSGAYHGVVLKGVMTNPFGTEADPVEMGPGSYWFVPAGEQHATRCVSADETCVFYFHAADAFDFAPVDGFTEARSHGAVSRPAAAMNFVQLAPFVAMAASWGDRGNGAHGTYGRFPGMASSPVHVHSGAYHGVVISGTMINPFADEEDPAVLGVGGYWRVPAGAEHRTACVSDGPCLFYFHAEGAFDFTPVCGRG